MGLEFEAFYRKTFAPLFLLDARPATFLEYETAVAHWKALAPTQDLKNIDVQCLAKFRAKLCDQPGRSAARMSHNTVNKVMRHVNAVLAKAGPPGPTNRDALGVVDHCPWIRPLRTAKPKPRDVHGDEVADLYHAARLARARMHPRIPPPLWWRALICLAVTTGYRRNSLMTLTWSTGIDQVNRLVHVDEHVDKAGQGRAKRLHPAAIKHLLAIRTPDDRVFPWPFSRTTWAREWQRIATAATAAVGKPLKFHDLKRFAGSLFAKASGGNPWVVQQALDHGSIETSRYYMNQQSAMLDAGEQLLLPLCFSKDGDANHEK